MCNSGVGLIPVVDGKVRHFSAGGLYDGMSLIVDDDTRSHWHHITGEGCSGQTRASGWLRSPSRSSRSPRPARLGLVVGGQARFYPFKALGSPVIDDLGGKRLRVEFPAGRSTPRATIAGEEAPFQLLTRWYGFAYAFPGCEIYGRTGTGGPGEGRPD